ncbi:MAG: arginine repressor [Eubacterium sp.]|nr:arginine repressor [Eubacterium sp.]
MKTERQAAMLKMIRDSEIETQGELAQRLEEAGFHVTQATVSRDIRELGITKVSGRDGKLHYAQISEHGKGSAEKHVRVLRDSVLSVKLAGNILVVKTAPGMAMAAAAVLDDQDWSEIVGCIAGDNTIFCAVAAQEDGAEAKRRLESIISG